jgi:shikimate dehydrogenase
MTPPKIYGLIGYPVKHSLSPAMHNAAFRALNINAEYRLFPLREGELKSFFAQLKRNNILGLNVTVPHKEKITPFLSRISPEAELIGAVNTIKIQQNILEGFNTDGAGFLKHLTEDLRFTPTNKKVAVIGAGGAARAVCVYLSREKPESIFIYDIDKSRAEILVNHLREHFSGIEFRRVDSIEAINVNRCSLLINATPVGLKDTDPCLLNGKFIHKDLLVYDLIYNPGETKLLRLATQKGAMVSNGLGMLLHQGAAAFELWTGRSAPVEVMHNALIEAMSK